MVKLTALDPQLLFHTEDAGRQINRKVDSLADANGIFLLCPACFAKNGGPVGTHGLIVTFRDRGVPDHLGSRGTSGAASRWAVTGASLADLTLRPSIDVGCWHGFVTNGEVTSC